MTKVEKLKKARNLLLKLHKVLVDVERIRYEGKHGTVSSGQFLGRLLEDPDFAWLRKFSTLIVDIDEMFDQKDGFSNESVEEHLLKVSELIGLRDQDERFKSKYEFALQNVLDAVAIQGELKSLLA